jgi:hypothetical protein
MRAHFEAEISPKTDAMNASDTSLDRKEELTDELKLKGSLKELFGTAVFRKNLIIMVIIWSFCAFAFFLVPFYLSALDE